MRSGFQLAPTASIALCLRHFSKPRHVVARSESSASMHGWERRDVPVASGSLAVWTLREAADRPPVLLVHGWAGRSAQMRNLGVALAAAGLRPVLIDLPAHGASSGTRSSLGHWSGALHDVQKALGRFHSVIAHSAGALAAAHAIARGLDTGALVMIAPPSPPADVVRGVAAHWALPESWSVAMIQQMGLRGGVHLSEFDAHWFAPQLSLPTLIVHDAEDRVAPIAGAYRIAALSGSAVLQITEGLGHQKVLQDQSVAACVADYVARSQAHAVNNGGGGE